MSFLRANSTADLKNPVDAVCPVESGPCACNDAQAGEVPNNVYGYGIVNAPAAVEGALAAGDERQGSR